ncbi:MAG: hypothetical protein ABIG90_00550 [bacterium]
MPENTQTTNRSWTIQSIENDQWLRWQKRNKNKAKFSAKIQALPKEMIDTALSFKTSKEEREKIFSKITGTDFVSSQENAKINPEPDIKQELAEHGVEIREPKQPDKYRETIL